MDINEEDFVYSVPVSEKKEGSTAIYRNPKNKETLFTVPSDIKSLIDVWDKIIKNYHEKKAVQDIPFADYDNFAKRLGSWMTLSNHNIIYLYSKNCPQWLMTDFACWNYGKINIPLYDTLGVDAFKYIIQLGEGSAIFTQSSLIPKILSYLEPGQFNVRELVIFDEIGADHRENAEKLGLKIILLSDILATDKVIDRPQLNLDQHLTYIFTSGTTGKPKGVVYTHRMVMSSFLPYDKDQNIVHMSYLPLAHIFERFVGWWTFFSGGNIQYMKLPITEFMKQAARIRPTILAMVPRLLKKLYVVLKMMYEKDGNKQVIKAMFGGRLQEMTSASASISIQILQFYKNVLDCSVVEGYGQTQTTGPAFGTQKKIFNPGNVGAPHFSLEWKLIDVPQLGYYTHNDPPRGQLLMRGQNVFKEYYKRPDVTKQTVDQDGWNHSGDIGQITDKNALKIIDRKNNLYKLSQGEYVAPEKIQNIYCKVKFISQTFVYGDSLKDFNIGFVHPNLQTLPMLAQTLQIQEKDPKKLCKNAQIKNFILEQMLKQGKTDNLFGFEQVKKIKLVSSPFMELGILTNTMKLQRNLAKTVLKEEIEKMYVQQ